MKMKHPKRTDPTTTGGRRGTYPTRGRYLALAATCVGALMIPAACGGSAVSPETAAAANRAALGLRNAADAQAPVGGLTSPSVEVVDAPAKSSSSSAGGGTVGKPGSGEGNSTGTPVATGGHTGPAAGSGAKAGSCDGFKNTTGITDKTITIGNSADISGPIPGLFTSAQQATKAYVQYFNATNPDGICGRKLVLDTEDTRTDAGADLTATTKFCDSVFAGVGSMSGFDSGGAAAAQSCGLPDIRTAITTGARNRCSSCFGAHATGDHASTNEAYDFYARNFPTAVKKAAFVYLNAGAAAENAKVIINVATKRGFKFVYTSPVDVADFNYGPYVQQMKSKGVQYLQFLGGVPQAIRMAQAMQAADFHPQVSAVDFAVYDANYLKAGANAIDGTTLWIDFTPFTEHQAELDLYKTWLGQVAPGATPTFYGIFAWSAAKLFVQQALALGGRLSRPSLVASLKAVHSWTGDGMHAPMDVGGKNPVSCVRFIKVQGGQFVAFKGTKYICHGTSSG